MKRKTRTLFLSLLVAMLATLLASPGYASLVSPTVTIDSDSGLATDIGDFVAIGPGMNHTDPGNTLDLLNTRLSTVSNSVQLGQLYHTLLNDDIDSTNTLAFGFSVNEQGKHGFVNFNQLQIDIERQDGSVQSFSLGGTRVKVKDQVSSRRAADAIFQINLGFDFMQEYSASSTRLMVVRAQLIDNNGDADRLFLSSQFTAHPLLAPPVHVVPLPASLGLFSSALLLMLWRKRATTRATKAA